MSAKKNVRRASKKNIKAKATKLKSPKAKPVTGDFSKVAMVLKQAFPQKKLASAPVPKAVIPTKPTGTVADGNTSTLICNGRAASSYQSAIIQWAVSQVGKRNRRNAVIKAVAGSGKTTMLKELAVRLKGNVLYLVFNNKNAREAEAEFAQLVADGKMKPSAVTVSTFNAFGYRVLRDNLGYRQVSEQKTDDLLKFEVIGVKAMGTPEGRKEFFKFRGAISTMVKLMKNLALGIDETDDAWPGEPKVKAVAEQYDVLLPANGEYTRFMELLRLTWLEAVNPERKKIDFEDQLYVPVFLKLRVPKYDYVLVDESQDANMLRILLSGMLRDAGATLIFVGDPNQAIYHFQGADAYAMQTIEKIFDPVDLPLSVCYRCGQAQVKLAKMLVPAIEPWNGADPGNFQTLPADWMDKVLPGDFVLCRVTAPLMGRCLQVIRRGKKAVVLGKQVGKDLVQFLQTAAYKFNDPMLGLIQRLKLFQDEQSQKLRDMDREEAVELLNDKVETLMALLESITLSGNIMTDIETVKSKVEVIFSDEVDGVTFSTIHRAKGLEADNVYVIKTELLPFPKAKSEEKVQQELNLAYIAMTRAKKNTYWEGGMESWMRIVAVKNPQLAATQTQTPTVATATGANNGPHHPQV